MILFLSIPICVGLIQISDVFVPWFFGKGYDGVIILLKVMAVWILVKAFSNCIWDLAIFFAGNVKDATRIIWIGTVFNVVLNILLIPEQGALGAAITSLITEILILILVLKCARNRVILKNMKLDVFKEIVAVSAMCIIMMVVKMYSINETVSILLLIFMGAVTYLIFVALMKVSVLDEVFYMIRNKYYGNNG